MLGQEYSVPPLHGPKDFSDFNTRYDKPIIDLIHDAGGRVHVHSHGSIKSMFQGFVDMGADVLHPFEPLPLRDIIACEAKTFARDKMCLEGNIPIHRMYEGTAGDSAGNRTTDCGYIRRQQRTDRVSDCVALHSRQGRSVFTSI